jgi:cell wall-associated NlpC family hydrolase
MAKTATGLVEYAKAQLGRPYWYGTFGQAANKPLYNEKKRQYPSYYKWEYAGEIAKVHDCVGLIKGYLWCDSPEDNTPVYNAAQDISANMMCEACTKTGAMISIPEVPGVLVFMDRHVGIYIGGGEVIEARGHAYGVVKTKLKDRNWKLWGYCPYLSYDKYSDPEPEKVKTTTIALPVLQRGSKGESVKAMQSLLIGYGFSCGSSGADGSFGSATDKALRAFQAANGLTVDGSCGRKTWSELLGVSTA